MQTGEQLHQEINEYLKQYDDAATWCAEVLEGRMRTSFEFNFDGEELFSHDGRPIGPIFENATSDAKQNALRDPKMNFEVRRREKENQEKNMMYAMMRGELPNTMIVISDFPEELVDETEDIGGYNVTRQQAMLRVITRNPNGTLTITSQSLDKSDRDGLESIYSFFGEAPEEGELLGQRIHCDLTLAQQNTIVSRLTDAYDTTLMQKFGGTWVAGRQPGDEINTYDFVREQADLLDGFVNLAFDKENIETLFYGLAAAITERFKNRGKRDFIPSSRYYSKESVRVEIKLAAETARAEKQTFSGCGLSLTGEKGLDDQDGSADDQLEQLGYGSKDKVMKCVNCPDCGTFHDEVKPVKGKYRCKNPDCGYTVKA